MKKHKKGLNATLFLWRHLNMWSVLIIVACAYAASYTSTVCRLNSPGLSTRMAFYAKILLLPKPTDQEYSSRLKDLLDSFDGKISPFVKLTYYGYNGDKPATHYPRTKFDQAVSEFAEAQKETPKSDKFYEAFNNLDPLLQCWSDRPPAKQRPLIRWLIDRFTIDDYKLNGVNVSVPLREGQDFQKEAANYLSNFRMFKTEFRNAP